MKTPSIVIVAALAITLIGCSSSVRSAAQTIANRTGSTADDVERTLGRAFAGQSDEQLIASFDEVARADETWTQRFMAGAEATYDVISSDEVGAVTDVMCDGLEQLVAQQQYEEGLLRDSAAQVLELPPDDPQVTDLANATAAGLGWHQQGSAAYTQWVYFVSCAISAAP